MLLADRVAIVHGATGAVGRAVADAFAAAGAHTIVSGRDVDAAQRVVANHGRVDIASTRRGQPGARGAVDRTGGQRLRRAIQHWGNSAIGGTDFGQGWIGGSRRGERCICDSRYELRRH